MKSVFIITRSQDPNRGVTGRGPNHLNWFLQIKRSSSSTPRFFWIVTLLQPCRGTSFPHPVLMFLFFLALPTTQPRSSWRTGCRLTSKQRALSLIWASPSPQTGPATETLLPLNQDLSILHFLFLMNSWIRFQDSSLPWPEGTQVTLKCREMFKYVWDPV